MKAGFLFVVHRFHAWRTNCSSSCFSIAAVGIVLSASAPDVWRHRAGFHGTACRAPRIWLAMLSRRQVLKLAGESTASCDGAAPDGLIDMYNSLCSSALDRRRLLLLWVIFALSAPAVLLASAGGTRDHHVQIRRLFIYVRDLCWRVQD